MNADAKSLIDEINATAVPKAMTVSVEEVVRRAKGMARHGYRFTDQTLGFVRQMCLGRGLLIRGDVGTGKSFFFYCAGIPAISMKIAQSRELKDICRALDSHSGSPIVVDDIGAEEADYKSYGTAVRLLDLILEKRAEATAPTHFTTNLTIEQLQARYGDRAVDRIRGMAVVAELCGESRRDVDSPRMERAWYEEFYRPRLWQVCERCCRFYDSDARACIKGVQAEPRTIGRGDDVRPSCQYF